MLPLYQQIVAKIGIVKRSLFMRTLGVYLLAGGISFNALATDISEVVVNYDGTQPIHKYLKHTDRNASISAGWWA